MITRVNELVSAGRIEEALNLVDRRAGGGDADALYILAEWRVEGRIIRRDLAEARRLMRAAAEAGKPEALLINAHFLANGTGGPSDWAAAISLLSSLAAKSPAAAEELRHIERMQLDRNGFPTVQPRLITRSHRPRVQTSAEFLTASECEYLVRQASPRLCPSTIMDRATGRSYPHPVRRSEAAIFGVMTEDLVVGAINRRLAMLTGTRVEQGEALEVISYGPGGEFRPHSDALPEHENQRVITAILYLTQDYTGGETRFVRSGLTFRGQRGDAIVFRNALPDGRPDPLTEHAGLPVSSGRKIIATRWIRASKPLFPAPAPIVAAF